MLDEFRSTLITWDKATSRIYSPVTANESDENGRKLVVQIVNGGQVEDLTGATLHLYWETKDKAHDGLDVFDVVDLKKGEFELSYTTGMLSNQGVLNANLVLIDTVGRVVSERFKITVTEGIDNDAIQSENSFTTLTQALIDVSNLETNYAPRLNDLTAQLQQTEQELSSQLAEKADKSQIGAPTQEQVDEWLDRNPQATTTVGEGVISEVNLASDLVKKFNDIVNFPSKKTSKNAVNAINLRKENAIGNIAEVISSSANYANLFIKVSGNNLIKWEEYGVYNNYIVMPSLYRALPIYLKPSTRYKVIINVKDSTIPPTLSKDIYINQNPDKVADFINAHNLKTITTSTIKTITTTASGLLFIMSSSPKILDLEKLTSAFDVMIVEDGAKEDYEIYDGYTKEVVSGHLETIDLTKYSNYISNVKRNTATELLLPLSDIQLFAFYSIPDEEVLSQLIANKEIKDGEVTKSKLQAIKPLYVDSIATIMRYGSYSPEVMRKDERTRESGTIGNTIFNFIGSAGDDFVTIIGGNLTLDDIADDELIAGVIQYDDGSCYSCSIVSVDSTNNKLEIYPPLMENVTSGEIGNLCVDGLHLSRRGYRAFAQNAFNANPKHSEKGKYTGNYSKTNYMSLTTSPTYFGGTLTNTTTTGTNAETEKLYYGYRALDVHNTAVDLLEQKSGLELSIPTRNKNGYCEVIVAGINAQNARYTIKKDFGYEMYIEFYVDGTLKNTYIKHDNPVEILRFDYADCENIQVKIYYNKWRKGIEHILLSDVTCWINEYDYGNQLLPSYKTIAQMFDSWGVFHNSETAVELSRLINDRDGVPVRYINNSLGSQTSLWGLENFYENVEKYGPQIMLIDFGINDANLGINQNDYKANMLKLCDLAIANKIQPIICFPSFGNTFLGDRQSLLVHQEVVTL